MHTFDITPKSTPRARYGRSRNGKVAAYNNPVYVVYKRSLSVLMKREKVIKEDPNNPYVGIALVFHIPVPKDKKSQRYGAKDGELCNDKKDIDNLTKAVMDTLQDAGFIKNDENISVIAASKKWTNTSGFIEMELFTKKTISLGYFNAVFSEKVLNLQKIDCND